MTFYQQEIERIRKICYSNSRQLEAVIKSRNFIDHHVGKDLHLNQLAQIGFTSKFHLLRLYKRYYGQTPQQYLTDRRIAKAKTCLSMGMPVTETCFAVGFECPASFSTLFKKKTSLTPKEFQKRAILTKC
jgi:methylphosphotriester-DNA--protein-cysteine methyltransferase